MHTHLFFLIDDYIQNYLILISDIVSLVNLDVGILKSFVIKIFFGQNFGTINHIRRNLRPFEQAQLGLHIILFRFLQTNIINRGNTRTHLQFNMKISLTADNRIDGDGHFREKSVLPIAFYSISHRVSGDSDLLSHTQSLYLQTETQCHGQQKQYLIYMIHI